MLEARRTLVKSPPELWAELSDPESLAKHLEAFGEIRITRLDPESTVAWEGDRARGTVELSASGWGTKVTISAEPFDDAAALQQPLAADVEAEQEPEPAPPAPEPAAALEPEEPEPVAPQPEPEPEPAADVEPEGPEEPKEEPEAAAPLPAPIPPRKRGLFARLFGRKDPEVVVPPAAPAEVAAVEEPEVLAPPAAPAEVAAVAEPEMAAPPAAPAEVAAVEEPEVAAPPAAPAEVAAVEEPDVAPADVVAVEVAAEEWAAEEEPGIVAAPAEPVVEEPEGEIRVSRLGNDEAQGVLDAVLDALGSAHHRPFSR
jgi:hypothetical protein